MVHAASLVDWVLWRGCGCLQLVGDVLLAYCFIGGEGVVLPFGVEIVDEEVN